LDSGGWVTPRRDSRYEHAFELVHIVTTIGSTIEWTQASARLAVDRPRKPDANMSAAEAARVGTGLAFVVMPLVFVFAFATHPALLRPRVLRPEQLIDRSRGRRFLHAGHGLVTLNTGLMIVVALYLGRVVTTHGAGWAGLVGTLLAVLGTVCLAADKGALCLTMSALDGLSDDEFAAARPALSAIFAKKGWLWLLWGIVLIPIGFAVLAIAALASGATS
jgi:hypothetical protein